MALSDKTGLTIKIGADVANAKKGIDDVRTSIGSLSNMAKGGGFEGLASGLLKLEGGLGAVAGPLAIATAGIGAVVGVAATAIGTMFALAQSAAEFGSQIYDMSVQTGLSATTLSALSVAAKQSDVEMGKVVQGLTKFSLLAGEAADGSDKATAKLAKFGLTSKDVSQDLEGSLAKVISKINELPAGMERSNAAAAAFGARGGKDMLKLIDQMDGDLPGLVQKMKELGLTIDDKAAKAADDFADNLTILGARIDMLKVKIGNELIPVVDASITALSEMLTESANDWQEWYQNNAGWIDAFRDKLFATIDFIIANKEYFAFFFPPGALKALEFTAKVREVAGRPKPEGEDKKKEGTFAGGGGEGGGKDAAKKAAEERRKDALDALKISLDKIKADYERELKAWEENLDPKLKDGSILLPTAEDIQETLQTAEGVINSAFAQIIANTNAQRDKELEAQGLSEQKKKNLAEEYAQKVVKIEEDRAKAIRDIREKAAKTLVDLDEREMDRVLKEQDAKDAQAIRDIENSRKGEMLKELLIRDIRVRRLELEKTFLGALAAVEETDLKRHEDFLKRIQEIDEAIKKLQQQQFTAPAAELTPATPGFLDGFMGSLGNSSMIDETNNKLQAMKGIGELLGQTFSQVAQGLGSMVQQWVLTGEVGPKAMRKLTASILAGLAAQAAVEALMELARGFANLAKFYVTGLPSYAAAATLNFQSAAIFGSIAGVAAVAGRAIAGDSFKNESSRATTGGGSSNRSAEGQGQAFSSQGNQTINATQSGVSLMPTAEIVIKDASGMFSQLFEAEIRNNSRVRRLIIDTANS